MVAKLLTILAGGCHLENGKRFLESVQLKEPRLVEVGPIQLISYGRLGSIKREQREYQFTEERSSKRNFNGLGLDPYSGDPRRTELSILAVQPNFCVTSPGKGPPGHHQRWQEWSKERSYEATPQPMERYGVSWDWNGNAFVLFSWYCILRSDRGGWGRCRISVEQETWTLQLWSATCFVATHQCREGAPRLNPVELVYTNLVWSGCES